MNATIVGNLTDDPELRFTNTGQALAKMSVACNRRWTDKASGEQKEETSYFDVTAWGTLAENVAESLRKGCRVIVEGRLRQERWDAEDGSHRSKIVLTADEISPSLRWSTCKVTKNERREADDDKPAPRRASKAQATHEFSDEDF